MSHSHDQCLFAHVQKKTSVDCSITHFNPLMPNSDLQILLCLTPDDFTRQRETPWALKGQKTISFNPLMPNSDL